MVHKVHSLFFVIVSIAMLTNCNPKDSSPIIFKQDGNKYLFWHENIHITINKSMYCTIGYKVNGLVQSLNSIAGNKSDVLPSHFIKLNDRIYKDFIISSHSIETIEDIAYGLGKRLTMQGKKSGIEKSLVIEMYDQYPDVALSWCTYTNWTGNDMTISGIYYNYYCLDKKLVNPEANSYDFRYLQPLNKKWGNTWTNLGITDSTDEDFQIPGQGSNRSGIPFIDVWTKEMGMAIFHVEGVPRFNHILLKTRSDGKVNMGFEIRPEDSYGQVNEVLENNASITTWKSALCVHQNDFFDAGRRFGQFLDGALRKEGRDGLFRDYPEQAYEPYWKTWGMNGLVGSGQFTIEEVTARMDELADYGFKAIMLDDGWFDQVGKWDLDPTKFTSEEEMISFVREAHTSQWGSNKDKSFKVLLWFDLLGANDTNGRDYLLVKNRDGSLYKSAQSKYAYCPSCKQFNTYIRDTLLEKIINKWDIDGLYTDWEDQNPLPCFDKNHHHTYDAESAENNYMAFKTMHDKIMESKPESGWVSMCACASVHDVYQYPYYFIGDGSDPVTNKQVRWRTKWIKAFRGSNAPVGDGYVDKMKYDQKAGEPAMSVATGNVITSLRWKVDELGGADHAKKWMDLFYSERLYDGDYLGLYDIEYHKPEGYVIQKKNGTMYFAFFDEKPFDREIELRGLTDGRQYDVMEYDTGSDRGQIIGPTPSLHITSKPGNNEGEQVFYYVLKCSPVAEEDE